MAEHSLGQEVRENGLLAPRVIGQKRLVNLVARLARVGISDLGGRFASGC